MQAACVLQAIGLQARSLDKLLVEITQSLHDHCHSFMMLMSRDLAHLGDCFCRQSLSDHDGLQPVAMVTDVCCHV